MKNRDVLFSVVIPCFNEGEVLPILLESLLPCLEEATDGRWEVLFINDGSTDNTADMIKTAHLKESRVKGIFLSRNFGHQPAVSAGLQYVSGSYIGIMDADLQDPPVTLIKCLRKAIDEEYDSVFAVRKNRKANIFLKWAYHLFYRLMQKISEHPWQIDAGDFSVINRRVVNLLNNFPEHVRIFRGLRSWVGLRQTFITYDRPDREKGESKYNIFRLIVLALNSIVGFTVAPLRIVSTLGFGASISSLLFGMLMFINRLFPKITFFGYYIGSSPGIATLVLLISFMNCILFLSLGLMGEYIATAVREIKGRPVAVVAEKIGDISSNKSNLIVELS